MSTKIFSYVTRPFSSWVGSGDETRSTVNRHCLHTLFPSVIHRLVTITSKYATLEASHDATLRQAQAANAELQRRIDQEHPGGEGEKKKVRRVEWRF